MDNSRGEKDAHLHLSLALEFLLSRLKQRNLGWEYVHEI